MTEEMKAKRQALKDLSAAFKILVKEGVYNTVNEGLANYYATEGHTELKSYRQWKQNGYQVKKGSTALLFWGEPLDKHKKTETATDSTSDEKKEAFYPLAYVFSQKQVEPIQNAA